MASPLSLQDAAALLIERAVGYGANAAESFAEKALNISAQCRLQKTESLEYAETSGVDLRVLCGKKQAVVSSSVLDEKFLNELAERAVQMAKCVPDDDFCGFADPEMLAKDFPDLDLYDPVLPTTESLLEQALKAENAGLDSRNIVNSDGACASYGSSEITMLSTTGFSQTGRFSSSSVSVSLIAEDKNGNRETDYEYSSAVYAGDLEKAASVGRKAAERAASRLGARKIKSGKMSVVLEPRQARGLLSHFCAAVNGAAIARGTSFLKDCLHKRVFPENISIIEDPLRKRGLNSRAFDAEGLPATKRAFIDKGVLTGWALDLRSARRLGMPPTGNGTRSLGGTPHPSMSNVTLSGGTQTPLELISDIKNGVYLTSLFGPGVNIVTGDYSRGAAGFLIENGKVTVPVHEITLAGNLKDMFAGMYVANDLEYRRSVEAPTVRLDHMSVAGK